MKYNFIDLFAGCGGLSEGFYKEKFNALAHVEIDKYACQTLKRRMQYYNYKNADFSVIEDDITSESIISKLDERVAGKRVDIIIGGPPCQAYSSLGRAKDEKRMQEDPRNFLFESYVKILNHFKPRFFVFENVLGMLNAKVGGNKIIDLVFKSLEENYKVVSDPEIIVLNSVNYGVPQIRKRVILIGVRNDIQINPKQVYKDIKKTHYSPELENQSCKGLKKYVTVRDAIEELPKLLPGGGDKEIYFVSKKNNEFLKQITDNEKNVLYDHVCRNHNFKDIERYKQMSENNWTFSELLKNRPDLSHSKRRVFGNSYVVQWWDYPSKTIIAHLYKDGNQFIHPDSKQGRTLTVREVARLQSFPDNFIFMGSRTQQYKQIGNAVPPLLAQAIAKSVKKHLKEVK